MVCISIQMSLRTIQIGVTNALRLDTSMQMSLFADMYLLRMITRSCDFRRLYGVVEIIQNKILFLQLLF